MPAKVSVMIMAYNSAQFIKEAVMSAVQQTYPNIQIVVTDNGSTDGTVEIVKDLAKKYSNITTLFSPKNMGISVNWNRGISACDGEYTAILFSDDLMLPDRIKEQVEFLEKNRDYAVCNHDIEMFDTKTGKTLYRWSDRFLLMDGGLKEYLKVDWLLGKSVKCINGCFMYRTAYVKTYPFDERFPVTNEWLHGIECLASLPGKWGTIKKVLGRCRIHDQQTSKAPEFLLARYEELMMVFDVAAARYPAYSKIFKNIKEFTQFQYLIFGWHPEDRNGSYEKQFRVEAGFLKWLYMRCVKFMLRNKVAMTLTKGPRALIKFILGR